MRPAAILTRVENCSYLALFFLCCLFYDYSKQPDHYQGVVPGFDFVGPLLIIAMAYAVVKLLAARQRRPLDRLEICALAVTLVTGIYAAFMYGVFPVPSYLALADTDSYLWQGYLGETINIIKVPVGYYLCVYVFTQNLSLRSLMIVLTSACLIHSVFGLHQLGYYTNTLPVNLLPIRVGALNAGEFGLIFGRSSGLCASPFNFGTLLQICAIGCFAMGRAAGGRAWTWIGGYLVVISLLTLSKSLFVGYIVIAVGYAFYMRRPVRFLLSVAALSSLVFALLLPFGAIKLIETRLSNEASITSRVVNNTNALRAISDSPLTGYGLGNRVVTDSTFTGLLLEGGLPRLAGYLAFFGLWLYRSFQMTRAAAAGIDREMAVACALFMVSFFVQCAMVAEVERMPSLLAMLTLYLALRVRIPLGRQPDPPIPAGSSA